MTYLFEIFKHNQKLSGLEITSHYIMHGHKDFQEADGIAKANVHDLDIRDAHTGHIWYSYLVRKDKQMGYRGIIFKETFSGDQAVMTSDTFDTEEEALEWGKLESQQLDGSMWDGVKIETDEPSKAVVKKKKAVVKKKNIFEQAEETRKEILAEARETAEPRFLEMLDKMLITHSQKQHDYAGDVAYQNFHLCNALGVESWKGCMIRMCDKFARCSEFTKKGILKVRGESFKDTLLDLANYAVICSILFEEELAKDD